MEGASAPQVCNWASKARAGTQPLSLAWSGLQSWLQAPMHRAGKRGLETPLPMVESILAPLSILPVSDQSAGSNPHA